MMLSMCLGVLLLLFMCTDCHCYSVGVVPCHMRRLARERDLVTPLLLLNLAFLGTSAETH